MVVGVWGGTFLQDGREYEYSGDMYQNTGPPLILLQQIIIIIIIIVIIISLSLTQCFFVC